MYYSSRHFLTAATVLGLTSLAAGVAYVRHKHASQEARIRRCEVSVGEREDAWKKGNLQTLPGIFLSTSKISSSGIREGNEPRLLHEKCSIDIPAISKPESESPPSLETQNQQQQQQDEELFTHLLRHLMVHFTSYPQARLFHFLLPTQRHTFSPSHIQNLSFVPGDLVCGLYRVVKRDCTRVEFAMEAPGGLVGMGVGGLLVVRFEAWDGEGDGEDEVEGEGGRGLVLVTETLQWSFGEGGLPLCRTVPRLLHEVASAGLLIKGAEWLGVNAW